MNRQWGSGVGIEEWFRHKMSRKQLVGMASQKMQAGGSKEVVVGRSRRFGRNG